MAINTAQWAVFWLEAAVLGSSAGALAMAAVFGLLLALVIVRGGKRPGEFKNNYFADMCSGSEEGSI